MSDEPSSKAPIVQQLAELLTTILKPGGVGVGGLAGLWLLFFEQKVAESIAAVLIGFCFSYLGKLLEPLHQSTQERLQRAGQSLNSKVDQGLAKITRFDDRYLLAQASACERDRPDIPRDALTGDPAQKTITTLLLEQVFVPLELDSRAMPSGYRRSDNSNLKVKVPLSKGDLGGSNLKAEPDAKLREGYDIWDFLTQARQDPAYRQLVVLAWGGYGKTTLLKHLTYCYGTKKVSSDAPKLVPVLLLRKYRDILTTDNSPNLPDLMTQHHIPGLPGGQDITPPQNWAIDLLRSGNALIMLDGFDEVPKAKRPTVAKWINRQTEQYPKSVFILTSRPKAYTEQHPADRIDFYTPLWVRDFNATQRQQFVQQWYWAQEFYASGRQDTAEVRQTAKESANALLAQIESRPELQALAKNPLLLNMIVSFHWRNPGAKLPSRRVNLYREICHLNLNHRPSARQIETYLTQCDAQKILQRLALAMTRGRKERVEKAPLLKELDEYLKEQSENIPASDFLDQVVEISELLVQQEEEYEFAHLSFQEYLAAAEIARQKRESLLYDHFADDWWKPTILLYAAQVNPTTLVREMIRQGAIDLAHMCLLETTKQFDPALNIELNALRKTVSDTRYAKLEELLKTQKWREADEETYRLMITTVGKEEGQWFAKEDLENFPCPDLKEIDRLWVHYSSGKWGFSVQKRIWEECGSPMEYNDDWEKFGDRVGWRKDDNWLSYSDLTFELQKSLPGGFPVVGSRLDFRVWGVFGLMVFSRAKTCEL
ncbi:GUN4 domain-containing protein [Thermoleptolyngbya sp.]